jgi:hypothetical protein
MVILAPYNDLGNELNCLDISARGKVMGTQFHDRKIDDGIPTCIAAHEQPMKLAIAYGYSSGYSSKPPVIILFNVTFNTHSVHFHKAKTIPVPRKMFSFRGRGYAFFNIQTLVLTNDMVFATYRAMGFHTNFSPDNEEIHVYRYLPVPPGINRPFVMDCQGSVYDTIGRRVVVTQVHYFGFKQARWKCIKKRVFRLNRRKKIFRKKYCHKNYSLTSSGNLLCHSPKRPMLLHVRQ